ncbi:MAG: hypothetical protein IPQ07_42385 [Myxococcales bacterium]|nr:hypothetical protein [Myxococcales bacterium]
MIEWLTIATLEDRLKDYPPIGLGLRGFFHGRIAASLPVLFEHEPETAAMEQGGDVMVWTGLVGDPGSGLPFSITAQRRGEVTGFEISFPVCVRGGRIDLALLAAVGTISPAFKGLRTSHIEHLPFVGEGFGVFKVGSSDTVFRSSLKEEADAVARVLDDPGRFEVKRCAPAPTQWVVAGPRSGTIVSRLEVAATREEAADMALAGSVEFGYEFEVHEGQLPPD